MTTNEAPEDLGAPVAYLVLKDGTPVFDESGARAGEVEHVLADDQTDLFHGLIVETREGHRFAPADKISGLFEHGVILTVPAADLPEPSEDPSARVADEGLQDTLKRAWNWLIQPR
ncbi:PRC-barrel domain-containing protein [Paractinoplanes lichenicola]|uniref:PRC-barrel domain-containing protein n=1 Tax=Paractinoplanes lichenicola TaxID=2802976 RepID=A0ABS1W137_9ACTN|nr:PRC-barrel domain-containing protein [Actinoplanes lichenicola]MBL7260450.1 PRC-barrel domain-containing protein [Actinoplanes lichenicola]